MDERTDARGPHVRSEADDIVRLQTILARRVLLIFAFPVLVMVALGVYTYYLSGKVDTLNTLQRITFIERMMQKDQAHEWALREYETLAQAYRHPQVLVRLGALYYADGRTEEALKILEALEKSHPEYWEIYSTAAYIHLDQNNFEKAIQAGEKALERNPWDAQTHHNLAWMYAHSDEKDRSKAQDYAVNAVAYTRGFNASSLETFTTVLDLYIQVGDIDRAIDMLTGVIKRINPDSAGVEFLHTRLTALRALQASVRNE